jgi:beta-phosphoglucomutase-like phosphatase (HAD superfamily)
MTKGLYRGAIFDLDGTLLDSMGLWARIDEEFLSQRGFAVPGDYVKTVAAMLLHRLPGIPFTRFSLEETARQVMGVWRAMARRAYADQVPLKPGACEQDILLSLADAFYVRLDEKPLKDTDPFFDEAYAWRE